ncbi:MAG: hypothetical protein NXH82_11780 [Rhodobacteraceae bacterium]|nr:hypothetical protein [Paracoccaceae bacterium]
MPDLIKLYIRSCVIGFAVAAVFVALLLGFDVMNMWRLVSGSDIGVLAVAVLWVLHGIVFAGVQFGYAVMSQGRDDDDDDEPGGGTPIREHAVVRVPVDTTTRSHFGRRPHR